MPVLKRNLTRLALMVGIGLATTLISAGVTVAVRSNYADSAAKEIPATAIAASPSTSPTDPSTNRFRQLAQLPQAQQIERLEQLARSNRASVERNRARYSLADLYLQQNRPNEALPLLDGLEQEYDLLADHVLLQKARAYSLARNPSQAQATWQQLLSRYPQSPAAAEALYALGSSNRDYWNQVLSQFPGHPRSGEIARSLLGQTANQPEWMLVLARYAPERAETLPVLDRLVSSYASRLSPDDWEAVAYSYWQNQVYRKAASAYTRATPSARNLYRLGRSLHRLDDKRGAYNVYARVVAQYPGDVDAGNALMRMPGITTAADALRLLDQAIANYPDRAAEAGLAKVRIYERAGNAQAAQAARTLLLSRYANSEAAAELGWTLARSRAQRGDLAGAIQQAQAVMANASENSEFGPQAGFWAGKWTQRLGQTAAARATFQQVLNRHPQSYYAWRSAGLLGWPVGNFNNARQAAYAIQPPRRLTLGAGSAQVQELYLLGADRDAWSRWQSETPDRVNRTVAQQFTDGVLRLGVNDNFEGIYQISSLLWQDIPPEQRPQLEALKQKSDFWEALYPMPYREGITTWARQRSLNPLLVMALIRQESRFEASIRSSAGALGLMQVMPGTGQWIAGKIGLGRYSLANPDDNLKLGTWYLDYTHREYSNNSMLAVASYNAGPGNVASWVRRFGLRDADEFVENIPFSETRGYVKSVFENYWNYLRLYSPEIHQELAQFQAAQPSQ